MLAGRNGESNQSEPRSASRSDCHRPLTRGNLAPSRHVRVGGIVMRDQTPEIDRLLPLELHGLTAELILAWPFDHVGHHPADRAGLVTRRHRNLSQRGSRIKPGQFHRHRQCRRDGLRRHREVRIGNRDRPGGGRGLADIRNGHALTSGAIGGSGEHVGYWLLVIGYWLLVIGYWLLVIGYWLLVVWLVYGFGAVCKSPPDNAPDRCRAKLRGSTRRTACAPL